MSDDYVYLGVTFNYNGSFKKAISKQITQARKAMFLLLQKAKVLRLPADIVCELFEVCVVPVLLYGSEIWGFENPRDIEIFHRKFLRIILRSYRFTPNCMLYGEINTIDMAARIDIKMEKFRHKLKTVRCQNFHTFYAITCARATLRTRWMQILNGAIK